MLHKDKADELKRTHWPKCDELADRLASFGSEAADALEDASKSRIHHVRSAALRGLMKAQPERGRRLAERLLNDRAYEVRETAAGILGVPIPDR